MTKEEIKKAKDYLEENEYSFQGRMTSKATKPSQIANILQEYAEAYAKEVNQEQPREEVKNDPLICKICKSPARDWPDLGRRTCGCGGLGYNVPK